MDYLGDRETFKDFVNSKEFINFSVLTEQEYKELVKFAEYLHDATYYFHDHNDY